MDLEDVDVTAAPTAPDLMAELADAQDAALELELGGGRG